MLAEIKEVTVCHGFRVMGLTASFVWSIRYSSLNIYKGPSLWQSVLVMNRLVNERIILACPIAIKLCT